jgi:hypothetical protein
MVSFTPVDPAELETNRLGRRGRVSYPLIKSFLESGHKLVKLDLEGLDKNPQYLRSVLTSYIKNHDLPVKLFSVQGDMHLMRLDINNDGSPNPDWKKMETTEGAAGQFEQVEPRRIDAEEVDARFKTEVKKSTK